MPLIIQYLKLRSGDISRLFLFQHAVHNTAVASRGDLPFAFKFEISKAHVRREVTRLAALATRNGFYGAILHLPSAIRETLLAVTAKARNFFPIKESDPFTLGLRRECRRAY